MSLLVSDERTCTNGFKCLARGALYALPVIGDAVKVITTLSDGIQRQTTTGNVFSLLHGDVENQLYTKKTTVTYKSSADDLKEAAIQHDRDAVLYTIAKAISLVALATLTCLEGAVLAGVIGGFLAGAAMIKIEIDLIRDYLEEIGSEKAQKVDLFLDRFCQVTETKHL